MKLDIPYYIRQVLREQRVVHIPGIGTFRLNQVGANFNSDKTLLSPPSLNISFDDQESDNDNLLKYILDTGLMSESKARKKLEQYTQAAFNKLLNVDAFNIDGIGKIVKRSGEEKVSFEPNLGALTREFGDLKPLRLTPVSRIAEQSVPLAFEPISPKVEESGSFIPRILALSLLLIALWFLGRYFYKNYFSEPGEEKTELVDPAANEEQDKANERELEEKYEAVDELIDPDGTKSRPESKDADSGETLSSMAERDASKAKSTTEKAKGDEENIDHTQAVDSGKGGSSSKDISGNGIPPTNPHADIIPKSGECIIIVGSFKKSRNAVKMSSLLEQKGYEVYRSQYKDFNRVGLKYECIDEDLIEYLQSIRKNVSKLAWYLDPSLDVPYRKM